MICCIHSPVMKMLEHIDIFHMKHIQRIGMIIQVFPRLAPPVTIHRFLMSNWMQLVILPISTSIRVVNQSQDEGFLLYLAQLVLRLLRCNTMHNKVTLGVIVKVKIFYSLVNPDGIHKTSTVGRLYQFRPCIQS